MSVNTATNLLPWYRQLWPWLLISLPASAVIAGAITLWLAISSNNSLVVDDYYREGKAINLELARDRRAIELDLRAQLARQDDGTANLQISSANGATLPPFVTLLLVHATRSELDQKFSLAAVGGGKYTNPQAALPAMGRWNLMLEDPDRNWRLVASTTGFQEEVQLGKRDEIGKTLR